MMDIDKRAELTPFDAADYLETPEDIAFYLEAVLEDGEPALIAAALGDVARSRGMSAVSRQAGVTREALYKALSENGDPKLSTLMGVLKAFGLQLAVRPETRRDDAA